jgi:hypothetical protein
MINNWYTATAIFDLQNDLHGILNKPLRSLPGAYGKFLPSISILVTLIITLNAAWLISVRLLHLKKKEPIFTS